MKSSSSLSRRDFVKTSVAGALALGVTGHTASAQTTYVPPGDGRDALDILKPDPRSIVISDLSVCEPASSLSSDFVDGKWKLVDYETMDGIKGVMVYGLPEHDCGEITLPLNVEGPHKIFLGCHYSNSPHSRWPQHGQTEVKLTDDAGFRRVAAESGSVDEHGESKFPDGQDLFKSLQETYWKTADLSGQDLIIRQPQDPYRWPNRSNIANISYVRLIPLNDEEIKDWEASMPAPDTRRLALIYCSAQLSGSTDGTRTYHPMSEQWFVDDFEAYKNNDIDVFVFEALRGSYCLYKTQIGYVDYPDNVWKDEWVDPLAAFTRMAHENDMKILTAMRMIGPQYPVINAPISMAQQHVWKYPQWRKVDADGVPLSNLSIAYPEVRQYWLSLLRETLEYGTDGVQLHLHRSVPFVRYEEPVVNRFKEKYGEDPRNLPEDDPRWIDHTAGYLTQFIREVRALVDEKPNRYLGVTVYGPNRDKPTDKVLKIKSYICDVETWLRQDLVDYVMPSKIIDLDVLQKWRKLADKNSRGAHIWPDLMPRYQTPAAYAQVASKYRDAGADGFCMWDGERRHPYISEWAAVTQFGHMDRIEEIGEEGRKNYHSLPLKVLGAFSAQNSYRDG